MYANVVEVESGKRLDRFGECPKVFVSAKVEI